MCCGRSNSQVSTLPQQASVTVTLPPDGTASRSSGPNFQYVGKTALTVVSPLTGKRYRFMQPGERVEVDARDQSWITFVPHLVRVG